MNSTGWRSAALLCAAALVTLAASPAMGAGRGAARSEGARTVAVAVSPPLNVTHDEFADNEESLGMSPNGQLLAGSWNDFDYNDGCGFSYSTDGGDHWAPRTFVPGFTAFTDDPDVPGTGSFPIAGDPSVAYNPRSGRFDVICQAFGGQGGAISLLATTFDPDRADPTLGENDSYGAAAWTTPVAVATGTSNGTQKGSNGKFPDHESIVVDTGSGPGHHFGRLFVAWAEFSGSGRSPIDVAFSDDDGRRWTGPIRVGDVAHKFGQDARPSIGPDGTVYLTWIASPNEKSLKDNVVVAAASTDGGLTWGANHEAASVVSPIPGLLPGSRYRIFEDAWSAVDQARGTLQIAFTDMRTGPSNIYVTHNLHAGDLSAWAAPRRVRPSAGQQFFPWVDSAPNGRVDVVYYDRTCDLPRNVANCVTLSSSTDGGTTWRNTALTTHGFNGDRYQACLAFVDPPDCGFFFLGDYIAVESNDAKAQVLYTGNGPRAMDVFSVRATF